MKTFWCVFMLVVLALPASLAVQTTTIIDDWIPYEYSFSHGENKYSIRGANAQVEDEEVGFIIIKKNDESGIHVPWNSCETTDAYKYCYVDRSFDNNKIDIDPQGQVQPALRVLIENFKDEKGVSVSRSFSSTNLFYDQETEVSITVTNTGDVALNLSLLEPVPQGFEIESYNKFTKGKDNTLLAEFILFPGGTWNAKYVLRAISYVSESYQTTVTYIPTRESGEEQTMQSSATTLSVQAPFALTEAIGSTSLDIRDEQSYTITIKNTEDEDIVVDEITLKYPPELQQILFDDVSQKQGFIASATADTLKPNESITYNIRGRIPYVGTYLFEYSGKITGKGTSYTISGNESFSVNTQGISCAIQIGNAIETINALEQTTFVVKLINNDDERFYTINGTINDEEEVYMQSLGSLGDETIINRYISFPASVDEKTATYTLTGTYASVSGQQFEFGCEKSITILPTSEQFVVLATTPETTIDGNRSVNITVTLSDAKGDVKDITLQVNDQVRRVSLKKTETISEIFEVQIPEYYDKKEFVVSISATAANYEYVTDIVFNVNEPYDWQADIEDEFIDEPEVVVKKKDEEKQTFWQKLVALVKDVFS